MKMSECHTESSSAIDCLTTSFLLWPSSPSRESQRLPCLQLLGTLGAALRSPGTSTKRLAWGKPRAEGFLNFQTPSPLPVNMPANPKPPKPRIPSPWEFRKLAEANRDAANAAFADIRSRDAAYAEGRGNPEFTFMAVTVAFLFLRSVELALKAAILERDLAPVDAIPSLKLGHDLQKLLECATRGGTHGSSPFHLAELGLDQAGKVFLEDHSSDYANKWFEYHFGPFHYPDLDRCRSIATAVVGAIASIARRV